MPNFPLRAFLSTLTIKHREDKQIYSACVCVEDKESECPSCPEYGEVVNERTEGTLGE